MSEIAVDFLAGTGWSSYWIERAGFPSGGYSHCASVLSDGRYLDARSDTLDGVPPGVQIRHPDSERWIRKCRVTLQVTPAEYASWEGNLRAKVTDKYDKDAILGFLEGRSIHTAGQWICSALAVNGIQHVGRSWTAPHLGLVPFPLRVPSHEISPDVLLLLLETAGFAIGAEVTA